MTINDFEFGRCDLLAAAPSTDPFARPPHPDTLMWGGGPNGINEWYAICEVAQAEAELR